MINVTNYYNNQLLQIRLYPIEQLWSDKNSLWKKGTELRMVLLNKVKRTISSLGFLAIYIYVYYSSKSKASNPDVQATMADHGKSLGVVEKNTLLLWAFCTPCCTAHSRS